MGYPPLPLSVAPGALRPHDFDWNAAITCVGDHIGGPAESSGGLAVPHCNEHLRTIDQHFTGGHVGFLGGLDKRKALDLDRFGEQLVVAGLGVDVESVAVPLGWDDHLDVAAQVEDGPCEELIGTAGQARHADKAATVPGEHLMQRRSDQLGAPCDRGALPTAWRDDLVRRGLNRSANASNAATSQSSQTVRPSIVSVVSGAENERGSDGEPG